MKLVFSFFLCLAAAEVEKLPIKTVHSRVRRYIAPGAVWTLYGGVSVIYSHMELRLDLPIHYSMDYLFGGIDAYLEAVGGIAGILGRKKR